MGWAGLPWGGAGGRKEQHALDAGHAEAYQRWPRGGRKAIPKPKWLSRTQRHLAPWMLASVFLVWDPLEVDPRGV